MAGNLVVRVAAHAAPEQDDLYVAADAGFGPS
jgi:hypothetical protein